MGVVTQITLDELNRVFPSFTFIAITPTSSGIIDTTYIVHTKEKDYVLKRYERDIPNKIVQDAKLLKELKSVGLNVSMHLSQNRGWHLYEKLIGVQPQNVKSYHIQSLGRFLAKMHTEMSKKRCDSKVKMQVNEELNYVKMSHFSYYKKFEFLKEYAHNAESVIHGDIFKDNTIFNGKKIGVIDFIDSICGTFIFDVAVALVGFDIREKNEYLINLFLTTYNQHAPKKLTKKRVKEEMRVASHFYALKRIGVYKNSFKAKELLR